MTVEEFKPIWEKRVARCFKEKKTFFWHKRIAEEIEKQKEWKAKHSDSGKLGAEKRWASLREKNSFSEKKSENSKEKSAEAKSPKTMTYKIAPLWRRHQSLCLAMPLLLHLLLRLNLIQEQSLTRLRALAAPSRFPIPHWQRSGWSQKQTRRSLSGTGSATNSEPTSISVD
jgi:hypothetical protein